jgi:hypothetical protein
MVQTPAPSIQDHEETNDEVPWGHDADNVVYVLVVVGYVFVETRRDLIDHHT